MSAASLIMSKGVDVVIQRPTITVSTGGGQVQTWTNAGEARVFIQPSSGSEGVRYGGESNRRSLQGFVAIGSGLRDGDRIVWNARTFDVQIHITPGEFQFGMLAHQAIDLEETNTSV